MYGIRGTPNKRLAEFNELSQYYLQFKGSL
jgi:hypothetical protein